MGALGGDLSTMAYNPAGIGLYRSGEFSFTPSLFLLTSTTKYAGNTTSDGKSNVNFGNMGFAFTKDFNNQDGGWKTYTMGFGYNRQNNFHKRFSLNNSNSFNSLTGLLASNAQGTDADNLDQSSAEYLAFQTYLIDTVPGTTNQYYPYAPVKWGSQSKSVTTTGSIGEWDFSYAANYNDKLYLGATLGFVRTKYTESSVYEETQNDGDTIFSVKSFSYAEDLTTNGSGINFKMGALYKITQQFRVGVALHTPTAMSLKDSYATQINSVLDDNQKLEKDNSGNFQYSVTTPLKAILSAAYVIGKKAIVSADYDYIDYTSIRMTPSNTFVSANNSLNNNLRVASNYRFGVEYRIDDAVSVRGGYALYQNPYKTGDKNFGSDKSIYSFGLGYRKDNFYIDGALTYSTNSAKYYMYDPSLIQPSVNNYKAYSLMCTIGLKFDW